MRQKLCFLFYFIFNFFPMFHFIFHFYYFFKILLLWSPESRVQSPVQGPVQGPVQVLECACTSQCSSFQKIILSIILKRIKYLHQINILPGICICFACKQNVGWKLISLSFKVFPRCSQNCSLLSKVQYTCNLNNRLVVCCFRSSMHTVARLSRCFILFV